MQDDKSTWNRDTYTDAVGKYLSIPGLGLGQPGNQSSRGYSEFEKHICLSSVNCVIYTTQSYNS